MNITKKQFFNRVSRAVFENGPCTGDVQVFIPREAADQFIYEGCPGVGVLYFCKKPGLSANNQEEIEKMIKDGEPIVKCKCNVVNSWHWNRFVVIETEGGVNRER